jgi:hypothetical protein
MDYKTEEYLKNNPELQEAFIKENIKKHRTPRKMKKELKKQGLWLETTILEKDVTELIKNLQKKYKTNEEVCRELILIMATPEWRFEYLKKCRLAHNAKRKNKIDFDFDGLWFELKKENNNGF